MENKKYGVWEYAVYAVMAAMLVLAYMCAWGVEAAGGGR